MARVLLVPLLLLALACVVRAQDPTTNGTRCFLQTTCTDCVTVPGCGFCVTPRLCADVTSLNAYCTQRYPGSVTILQSQTDATGTCALFPPPETKKCLDTDVNLTNGQLAGIIVGVILATAIIVPGAIVVVFFIFKAASS